MACVLTEVTLADRRDLQGPGEVRGRIGQVKLSWLATDEDLARRRGGEGGREGEGSGRLPARGL